MPNCPLRDAADIRASWDAFRAAGGGFQISTYRYPMFNPAWTLVDDGRELRPFWPDHFSGKAPMPADPMLPTGAIWWATLKDLLAAGDFYGPGLRPFPLPWHKAVDIDTAEEFRMAEMLAAARDAAPGLFEG
jgi:N-acylneuraminate cytidylyltransferase